ncbi:MAG: EAL domain-containing protein [Oceanospirillaceae bacterium]|nr:EAL domain-containing protein [Oceanospirillaceae bacterium]MCP5350341.1 EAL domain-containing protein [Oceanospirillaceae bacterium]
MQAKEAIRLLICADSQHEAETLTSLLRNSGQPTRAHLVASMEDLQSKLNEKTWDVCLTRMKVSFATAKEVLGEIQRLGKDVPTLFLTDEVDSVTTEKSLKLGAQDVLPAGEYNHILQVMLREIRNLKCRRELRAAEVHLREAEKRCQVLLESAKDAIAYVDDGMHLFVNESYAEIFGYEDPDDLLTMPLMDMVSEKDQGRFKVFLKDFLGGKARSQEFACSIERANGTALETKMIFSRATYEDEPCTQIVMRANHANAELEDKLKEISSQDLLTGLYNKQYFQRALTDTLDKAVIAGTQGAVVYINTDGFGKIKSKVGIDGADLVVSDLAHLIKSKCREEDLVARIGEDVFGVLLLDANAKQAQGFAEHICKAIAEHMIAVEQRTIQATASIGIALINESSRNPKEVLQRAHEAADYVRKIEEFKEGNGVYLYNPAQLANTDEERLKAKVEIALKKNGFKLLFQPIINLRDEAGEHYETLLRLVDEDGKEISPQDFINDLPGDLKRKVDRWVFLQTTKLLADNRSRGTDTRIFINLTNESLVDPSLLPWIATALKTLQLPPHSLILQFSESDAVNYLKHASEMSQGLTKLGCKIAISRFGCAVNPFNLFEHVHVDYVKVDGSFTTEIGTEKGLESLKELLAGISEREKASIVPLVENANIVAHLWSSGVNFIQGYYLRPPTAAMDYQFDEE